MKLIYWLIGIAAIIALYLFAANQPADVDNTVDPSGEPVIEAPEEEAVVEDETETEDGEVVIPEGWEEFESKTLGITFAYPKTVTWPDGDRSYISSISTEKDEKGNSRIVFELATGGHIYHMFRSKKPADQTPKEFVQAQSDENCGDFCPTVSMSAAVNPNNATDFVYILLGHDWPTEMPEIMKTVRFN